MSPIETYKPQHTNTYAIDSTTLNDVKKTNIEDIIVNEMNKLFSGKITYATASEAETKIAPILTSILLKLSKIDPTISNKTANLTTNYEKISFLENYLQDKNYYFTLLLDKFINNENNQVYAITVSLNKITNKGTSELSRYLTKADLPTLENVSNDIKVLICGENILEKFVILSEEAIGTGLSVHMGTFRDNNIIIFKNGVEKNAKIMNVSLETSMETIIANEMGHIYFNLVMKDALPNDIKFSFIYKKDGKTYNSDQLSEAFSDLFMLYHISDNPMLFQKTLNQIVGQTIKREGYNFSQSILRINYQLAIKKLQAEKPDATDIDFNQFVKELLLATRNDIVYFMGAILKKKP